MSLDEKRSLISPDYKKMSISKQCKILGLSRSSLYFKPKGESALNQQLMKVIDRKFLECPFYGVKRMVAYLKYDLGYLHIGENRVRNLYKKMAIETLYPKPKLSKADRTAYKYPYLLKGLEIIRPNQVWEEDITYIPMANGFMYMFAIIDVYSRKIMNWGISNTMTVNWCMEIVNEAIEMYGAPEIFNTDQGTQFTSEKFTNMLKENKIRISMDGRNRALDNIYIERFWRSIKYEKIYLNPPNGGVDLYQKVNEYVRFYNEERRHQSLDDRVPDEIYFKRFKNVS